MKEIKVRRNRWSVEAQGMKQKFCHKSTPRKKALKKIQTKSKVTNLKQQLL